MALVPEENIVDFNVYDLKPCREVCFGFLGEKYCCQGLSPHEGDHHFENDYIIVEWDDNGVSMIDRATTKLFKVDFGQAAG